MKKTVKIKTNIGTLPTRAPFNQYESDLGSAKRSGISIERMRAIAAAVSFRKTY